MLPRLAFAPRRILLLGAHPDDVEIGCGGAVLKLIEEHPSVEVRYVAFSASKDREAEARAACAALTAGAAKVSIDVHGFRDSFFPWGEPERIKEVLSAVRKDFDPDVVFTHRRSDLHQDHELISQLTWTQFRDHMIFEYEIAKFEGDFGTPNVFVPLTEKQAKRKVEIILESYKSQHNRSWFRASTFEAVLRLRGVECNAPEGFAEAFHCRKVVV